MKRGLIFSPVSKKNGVIKKKKKKLIFQKKQNEENNYFVEKYEFIPFKKTTPPCFSSMQGLRVIHSKIFEKRSIDFSRDIPMEYLRTKEQLYNEPCDFTEREQRGTTRSSP